MIGSVQNHLKKACQLTGSNWAALAGSESGCWFITDAYHLNKTDVRSLTAFLSTDARRPMLERLMRSDRPRSMSLPKASNLPVAHLHLFPIPRRGELLVVGAARQAASARRLWGLISELLGARGEEHEPDALLPNLQTELAYDMPKAFDRLLLNFVRAARARGAWLGLRRGDTFSIEAQWNDAQLMGVSLPFESSKLLRRLYRTRAEVAARRGEPDWQHLPHPVRNSASYWTCFPLVVGQRLIGAMAIWGDSEIQPASMQRLKQLTRQYSQPVEVLATLKELTGHLRRLAMLNDFALAISSAQNLDQIARRVLGHLARTFPGRSVALYLASVDSRFFTEYRTVDGKLSTAIKPAPGHAVMPFLMGGALSSDLKPVSRGGRAWLKVPLRFRGQTIGLLSVEGGPAAAFSEYDEHLLVVIASHLAGLVEYGRVREEAEARAQNLGLIHEVVQQVIGLNDKAEVAQITAGLLSQFFAYEWAAVVLAPSDGEALISGFSASRHESGPGAGRGHELILHDWVAESVLRTGESLLVDDVGHGQLYRPTADWDGGSELCVPLKQGSTTLGVIDLRSSRPNAFTSNDRLAMESLAGVLSAVLSGAIQYEQLEATVGQLREAQVEVRARLAAQQDAESRLVQAAKLAAVGEMAAGIAHELNNPLTTVTGFAELILDDTPKDASYRADIEMVLQEALRARSVVRRLLDFARQGDHARARSDINEILEDVLALSRHFIHTNGVELEVTLRSDLPWISVDTNQMKQVFLNLLHNAVHAMPTGGRLRIRTESERRDERAWVVARIIDTGIGINPGDIDRVFEPFFTTRGARGGTGLGLSVTYGIVTDHGGRIDVESRPGEGSSFSVWLPA